MRIVAVSDLHLDHFTRGVSRFEDISSALHHSVDHAVRVQANCFACLGDLCDPDVNMVPFRALNVVAKLIMHLYANNIPSIWIAGNHDVIEDGSGATTLTPLRALQALKMNDGTDAVRICETPSVFEFAGCSMLALPFTPTVNGYDPTQFVAAQLDTDYPLVILSHLAVTGVQPGEETTKMPRGRDIVLPDGMLRSRAAPTLVLQGHYHRRQVFRGNGVPVHVVGSLAQLNFGEEDNAPGFLDIEWTP